MTSRWMKPVVALTALLGAAAGAPDQGLAAAAEAPPVPLLADTIINGVAGFGIRLLADLSGRQPGQSVVVSPYGLATALAMTAEGAAGTTRSALTQLLGLGDMSSEDIATGHQALRTTLSAPDAAGAAPVIANSLWGGKGVTFAEPFQARQRQAFAAVAESVDFASPDATKRINDWVSTATSGKISQIVPLLPPTTPLVLVTAVHFKGAWETAFNPAHTRDQPFTLPDGKKRMVPLMIRTDALLSYRESPEFQAVTLPYKGERLGLTVLLPSREGEAPAAFLENAVKALMASRAEPDRAVTLSLPRASLTFNAELHQSMDALGAGIAFTQAADFSAMTTSKVLLDRLLHAVSLTIDEQGTEAAAATAVTLGRGFPSRNAVMTVDRPYYLLLHPLGDLRTILFLAYVADPQPPGP